MKLFLGSIILILLSGCTTFFNDHPIGEPEKSTWTLPTPDPWKH